MVIGASIDRVDDYIRSVHYMLPLLKSFAVKSVKKEKNDVDDDGVVP